MKNALRFALVLGSISVVAALGIAGVYQLTRERILFKERATLQGALSAIFPEATAFVPLDMPLGEPFDEGALLEGMARSEKVAAAMRDGEQLGFLAVGRRQGYASSIAVLVGARPDMTVAGIRVIASAETPGLGERISEVASDRTAWRALGEVARVVDQAPAGRRVPWFQAQFENRSLDQLVVVRDPQAEGIQAITAATVTSEAVTAAVRDALAMIARAAAGETPSAGVTGGGSPAGDLGPRSVQAVTTATASSWQQPPEPPTQDVQAVTGATASAWQQPPEATQNPRADGSRNP